MEVCCGKCHVELKKNDKVILDDLGILRHEKCYDFASKLHLIDTVGTYETVKDHFPSFLIDVYREIIAMDPDEEISDAVDEMPRF